MEETNAYLINPKLGVFVDITFSDHLNTSDIAVSSLVVKCRNSGVAERFDSAIELFLMGVFKSVNRPLKRRAVNIYSSQRSCDSLVIRRRSNNPRFELDFSLPCCDGRTET